MDCRLYIISKLFDFVVTTCYSSSMKYIMYITHKKEGKKGVFFCSPSLLHSVINNELMHCSSNLQFLNLTECFCYFNESRVHCAIYPKFMRYLYLPISVLPLITNSFFDFFLPFIFHVVKQHETFRGFKMGL